MDILVEQIIFTYSCQEIWSRIYNWVQESGADITGYGNGFDRKGKAYLNDILHSYPQYAEEILALFLSDK